MKYAEISSMFYSSLSMCEDVETGVQTVGWIPNVPLNYSPMVGNVGTVVSGAFIICTLIFSKADISLSWSGRWRMLDIIYWYSFIYNYGIYLGGFI